MTIKVIYGSDYRGIELRKKLIEKGIQTGYEVQDIGIPDGSPLDYIDISKRLAEELCTQPDAFGIMACGSGQGVAIALNRFTHIRAGMCRTVEDALNIREKLNANVITLGSKQNTLEESFAMVDAFVQKPFEGGKHSHCVAKLGAQQTPHATNGVNLIVRALIIHEKHMLLSTTTESNRDFPQGLYFLPGGHVEYTEGALEALKRELHEEMNVSLKSAIFMGALECTWDRKGSIYHELNLVYRADIPGLSLANPPVAIDHAFHKFVWVPLSEIDNLSILPESLKPMIAAALDEKSPNFYSQMIEKQAA